MNDSDRPTDEPLHPGASSTALSAPREGEVRLVPLGGLGEIGMNCLALEDARGILVIDCGITFPGEDLGIDVYHPDLSFLEARRDRVLGVFLTHGHEDHVGALPYLLERLDVPIWGPPHALAVARHRLAEHGFDVGAARLIPTRPRTRYAIGPFEVEPIRVTHSIADATALAIRTAAGLIVHTGDFKFDPCPPDGELTDEARLAELGREGVALLLSDSTNIDARSEPGSESEVGLALEPLLREAPRATVIGMFASNLQRLRTVGEICQRLGRKVSIFGRSLELSVEWGHTLGRLDWPADFLVARDRAKHVPPTDLVVLAGGTQAEPNSALSHLSQGTHPALRLEPDDTVILSSRIIPGNDRPVFSMMAGLLRQRVRLHSSMTDPGVHVSGHAHRVEQVKMLELVRPKAFVPVHGTLHHLTRHAELARECGVRNVVVLENGDVATLAAGGIERGGRVSTGRVATWGGTELAGPILRERRTLARAGALHVSVVLDAHGRLAAPPAVWARGVLAEEQDPSALRFISREVAKALEGRPSGANGGDAAVAEMARLAARRAVENRTGRRPLSAASITRL